VKEDGIVPTRLDKADVKDSDIKLCDWEVASLCRLLVRYLHSKIVLLLSVRDLMKIQGFWNDTMYLPTFLPYLDDWLTVHRSITLDSNLMHTFLFIYL